MCNACTQVVNAQQGLIQLVTYAGQRIALPRVQCRHLKVLQACLSARGCTDLPVLSFCHSHMPDRADAL